MKYLATIILLTIFTLLFSPGCALGQSVITNPANVNVNELSNEQIDQIIAEIKARGLTLDQAIALAQSRGASRVQIDQLMNRIQQRQLFAPDTLQNKKSGKPSTMSLAPLKTSEKAYFPATEKNKKIFGYQLFNSQNLSFEPSLNIPVPKNYVLGIGDQVVINVWGASQSNYQLTVEQDGSINIPFIGPVSVSGFSFDKAQAMIKKRLLSIYSGMAGSSPNTWAEVSLGVLRSIKVNIVGEINAPGTYTVPATASAFNVLYLSGGPNENGSFREIRVVRDGIPIHIIDVYNFLLNADPSSNIQLRDQDIIFVPPFKKRVETAGQFKRNGLYELLNDETVGDLIRYTGGFTDKAYTNKISIIRKNDREQEIRDISELDFPKFKLQNGDSIYANNLLNRYSNRVSILGAVLHPGNFEFREGMRLSELIKKADGLREDAFMNRGLIARLKQDNTLENIAFNVKEVSQGISDVTLKKEDAVTIRSLFDLREKYKINIVGEVNKPQSFDYTEGMRLGDLVFRAGGFKEAANLTFIEVTRRLSYEDASKPGDKMNEIYQFPITRDLKLNPGDAAFVLKPFDEVYVRRAPGYRDQGTVLITGEVLYTGSYSISNKNERISDIINRAGGLLKDAYVKGANLMRTHQLSEAEIEKRKQLMNKDSTMMNEETKDKSSFLVGIDLEKIMASPGSSFDLLVQPDDQIFVPRMLQTVKVSGNVMNPLAVTYDTKLNLRNYISLSGGYDSQALRSKTYVIYPNGTSASTRGFIFKSFPKVTPGSEIFVPKKTPRVKSDDTMRWLSIASIIASIAVSVATLKNILP